MSVRFTLPTPFLALLVSKIELMRLTQYKCNNNQLYCVPLRYLVLSVRNYHLGKTSRTGRQGANLHTLVHLCVQTVLATKNPGWNSEQ